MFAFSLLPHLFKLSHDRDKPGFGLQASSGERLIMQDYYLHRSLFREDTLDNTLVIVVIIRANFPMARWPALVGGHLVSLPTSFGVWFFFRHTLLQSFEFSRTCRRSGFRHRTTFGNVYAEKPEKTLVHILVYIAGFVVTESTKLATLWALLYWFALC